MKRVVVISLLMFACMTIGYAQTAAPPVWNPPIIEFEKWDILGSGTIVADPVYKKIYVGTWYNWQRKNLLVFDMAADGSISGPPRRYLDHPDELPINYWSRVDTIVIDHKRRRLWMGVATSQPEGFTTPMVTYALNANGEPVGEPEAYSNGNPHRSCTAFALHPKLNRLYTVGWGSGAVWAFDLGEDGKPVKGPIAFEIGGIGKYSLVIRPDGSKAYLGTHPSTLAVCDLDEKGNFIGKTRFLPAKDAPAVYLIPAINARGIYFKGKDNKLWYFRYDANGEPLPDVMKTEIAVQAVGASGNDRLVIAEPHVFPDAITGKLCTDGAQLKEMALQPDGTPGTVVRASKIFPRQETQALTLIPGIAAATKHMGWGFLGNRFAGLRLRATLTAVEADGILPPGVTAVTMHEQPLYLRFAYSATHNCVYAAGGDSVAMYPVKAAAAEPVTLPCANAVDAVAVDETAGRLFVAKKDGTIALFTLGANGKPVDTGKTVTAGISPISALRVNPKTHQVYVFGQKQAGVTQTAGTEGKVVPVPTAFPATETAIDPVRGRLYATTNYNAQQNIVVWKLAADGTLQGPGTPTAYADGIPQGENKVRNLLSSLRIDPKRNRLYASGQADTTDRKGWIIVYTLDGNGDPTGQPRLYETANKYNSVGAITLSNDGKMLYDGGFGDPRVFARAVDANGEPKGEPTGWNVGSIGKSYLQMTADNGMLLIGTHPTKLEVIRVRPDGRPLGGVHTKLTINNKPLSVGTLTPGLPSEWVPLDDLLKDSMGIATGRFALSGVTVKKATLKIEVGQAQGATVKPLATVSTSVLGDNAVLFLPHYGMDDTSKIAATVQTSEMRFKQYLATAQQYAVAPEDRPKQFVVANGLILMDPSPAAMEYGMQVLATLGHNTAEIWKQLPGDMIRASALRHGITRFRQAVYNPPSYFDYNPEMVTPEYLDKWVAGLRDAAVKMGAKPEELALYHIGDEPGWYYSSRYKEVMEKPERLAVFRDYLKSKGLTPQQLGKTTWEEVLPAGLSTAVNLPAKRLFYWTSRFYVESFSKGFAAATEAFQRGFHAKIFTGTNLNNWPGHSFIPSPGKLIANNRDNGPDAAYAMPDWFDLGRKKAVTSIWTEDWFGDREAQKWSLYADLLRCAAREGGVEYGGYPVGHTTGHFEDGGAYKIMALIGHGGKVIDPYIFGPNAAFGDGWSEKPQVYKSLADAIRLLGKSERLTYPGRPRHGTVAIQLSQASQLWDGSSDARYPLNELYGLHAALIHSQYPVDFIDDVNLEVGDLTKYGYATLYITGPNLSVKAQQQVLDWVKAGGTLVLLPGAAQADEYNEPTNLLAKAMGASWGTVERAVIPRPETLRKLKPVTIAISDGRFGTKTDATALQTAPLTLAGGKPLATFADGKPALVEMAQGNGRILSYGYWPGWTYWSSADRTARDRLPQQWAKETRQVAIAPARIAGAKKHVAASADMVEAALLESESGIAVTLLNWGDAPVQELTVTVQTNDRIAAAAKAGKLKVSSVRQGVLKYTMTGHELKVTLPMKTVDVLMIE